MAFEAIENPTPVTVTFPDEGMTIAARSLKTKNCTSKYIQIKVGKVLAKQLAMCTPETRIDLLFGTGPDHGKIRLQVNVNKGAFAGKRDKLGRYSFTISAAAADGLFSLDFEKITFNELESKSDPGKAPHVEIECPPELLCDD